MDVREISIKDVHPYEKNPRRNDDAVEAVANSIREFGFRQPIVVDKDMKIIVGHTRYKAAKRLKMKTVPVLIAEDMSEEQVKAYRIADNSTNGLASWDYDLLLPEIEGLSFDMADFGMNLTRTEDGIDFSNLEQYKDQEHTEEYDAFLDKFKEKHTTDDCFTPPEVYDAIVKWATERYGLEGRQVVRPFYPGGDYEHHAYPEGCVVIDNPPFSIASEIIRFYIEHGIDFFLFANHLTAFHSIGTKGLNIVIVGANIEYDNGAQVLTSFHTNLGDKRVEIRGDLYQILMDVQQKETREMARYKFPANITTAALLGRLSKYGMIFDIESVEYIKRMENGPEIYGGGIIMSEKELRAILKRILAETPTDTIKENKPSASRDHPTMKPTALLARMIYNSSRPGDIILDPFGGSGSTMMACEQLHRRCAMMELDPIYCDVIVKRWETLTGKKAEVVE